MAAHSILVARARPVGPGQLSQHNTDLTFPKKKASPRCAGKLKLAPLSEHLRLCHGNGKAKEVQRSTPATLRNKRNTKQGAARRKSQFAGPGVVELHSFPPKTSQLLQFGAVEQLSFPPTQSSVSLWLRHAVRPPVLSDRAKRDRRSSSRRKSFSPCLRRSVSRKREGPELHARKHNYGAARILFIRTRKPAVLIPSRDLPGQVVSSRTSPLPQLSAVHPRRVDDDVRRVLNRSRA